MADELSLLWKLRADNTQTKTVVSDTRAAISTLQRTFGPELSQTVSIANKAFSELGSNITNLAAQRLPIVGNAVISITSQLQGFNDELRRGGPRTAELASQIDSLSKASGKSTSEVTRFLTTFVGLKDASARNEAAFKTFGGSVDLIGNKTAKFLPELEKAGTALAGVSEESAAAGAAIGGMALPITIAVAGLTALAAGVVITTRELVALTKQAAEFQGRLYDLSQQTGVAVETLSALEVAAKKVGGEVGGGVTQSLVAFQRQLDAAQDPLSEAAKRFRDLNVDTSDTETAFRQTLAALAAMPEGFKQTNAAAELFGARGGKQVLAILKETGGDLDALIKSMRDAQILVTTDAARAADRLNDELALLDFQIRAAGADIARELIPALADIAQNIASVVRETQPLLRAFSSLTRLVTHPVTEALKGLRIIVAGLTGGYSGLAREIKRVNDEAAKARDIPALNVPGPSPVPLPTQTPEEAAKQASATADVIVATAKRAANEQAQALTEAFERGRITREQQAAETIAVNQRVLDAEKIRIQALIDQKNLEIKALERGTDAYQKTAEEIQKLQQQQLDAESLFETTSREIRARAAKERADSRRNEEQNTLDNLLRQFDRQVAAIEAQITREEVAEETGLSVIEAIEDAKLAARRETLEAQKRIGFLTVENQKEIDEQLRRLGDEAAALQDQQNARRLQRSKQAAERTRQQQLDAIDAALELQQIVGERTIATIESLADLRVISEEEAAGRILQVRLDLIDEETKSVQSKLSAAASISNISERTKTEAELNARLKVLTEQRKGIQTDGDRAIDEGRQRDLENERRYANELKRIKESIRDLELEAAREVIDLMRLHFASRKEIIAAELNLELDRAKQRHNTILESIREDQRGTESRIKALGNTIKALETVGKRESEEYQRAVEELERANEKKSELHAEEEAELDRSAKEKERILREARLALKDADTVGRLTLDIDNLKEFASIIEGSIVPLGEILTNTFHQVADAIGQTVANWVLLGETGPAVMRKILAQALASIAAEAAVNAIKELALGFATLFFNPAESAAHFTAAGLWASIGGVAAVVGRGVAGDLFKQKSAGGNGDSGGSAGSQQVSAASLARNAGPPPQPVVIKVDVTQDRHSIVDVYVDDFRNGGRTRQVTNNDGGV